MDINTLTPVTLSNLDVNDGQVVVPVGSAAANLLSAWSEDGRRMAVHEAAHCVIAARCGVVTKSLDIKGRGHGRTETADGDDDQPVFDTESTMKTRIVIYLAGLIAEQVILGEGSDGSRIDLEQATNRALELVGAGLAGPFISPAAFSYGTPMPPNLAQAIADSAMATLQECRARALSLVEANRTEILTVASRLYAVRRLDGNAIDAVLTAAGMVPPERRP